MTITKRKRLKTLATKRKVKPSPAIEEVKFDVEARQEYLSGFHKRKVQRAKVAKEHAITREREEKIAARKALRDERRADLQRHVDAVNAALRPFEETQEGEDDELRSNESSADDGSSMEPEPRQEAEYIDEGKYTSVTIDAVEIDKSGIHTTQDSKDEESQARQKREDAIKEAIAKEKDKKARPEKVKKKKFRYESKAERKVTSQKQKMGNRIQARIRKS